MTIISQPKTTVNKLPALLPVGIEGQVILVIGQKLAAGTATSGQLYEDVSKTNVNTLFGQGSFVQNALNGIFDVFERSGSTVLPQVDVIPLDDGSGTPAAASVVVSTSGGATATEAGTIDIIIGSKFLYTASVDVAIGDTIIGGVDDAITAAINAFDDLPVTAVNTTGTIALTCRHDGTIGNGISLKSEGLILSGSDYVMGNVEITLTGFASGATDPAMPDLDAVVGTKRYQTITHPLEYGIAFSVTDFLDDRFNVDNDILDGVAIVKATDTLSNLKTALGLLNSQSLVYLCDKTIATATYIGSALIDLDFVLAARVAATRALRLTEDANIVRYTLAATLGANDASGGIHIATLPYFNTPVFSVTPIDTGIGFLETEIEELDVAGGAVIGNNVVGNTVILGEILTTYKTDSGGNPDTTWHFLNIVDTMSVSAEYFFNNIKRDFAQTRLTEGNLIDGYSMTNASAFKGQLKKYYTDLSVLVIVPSGKEAIDFFMDNLSIAIDMSLGKITANGNLPIVVQLREILVNLRTTFTIGG